ncbi:MAG TPA: zinc ribbon domain-containing protein [Anaerolineaceae bacterium]|nr:zinc ribbon domain-containing protein [Anaerolineaceae bacterium]
MARKSIGYVQLVWFCPSCGTRNPGTQRTCQGCGLPQPGDVKFQKPEQDQAVTDEAVITQAKRGADIHCAYCGARNPAGTTVCIQCGADLTTGIKRDSGEVLGAHQTQAVPEKACPNCKTPNPINSQTCIKCGAPLSQPQAVTQPPAAAKKLNPIFIIIGIIIAVVLCIILSSALFSGNKSETVSGVVDSVYWERSVAILGLVEVEKEDWYSSIPSDAVLGNCTLRYHHTQDQMADNSQEVCGTPYVVDTGSGVGELVQDCVYEVYMDYCSYTGISWATVDTVTQSGYNLNAAWPQPSLSSQQQLGDRTEVYICRFDTGSGLVEYQTRSYEEFSRCQVGKSVDLEISAGGRVLDFSN